MRVNNIFESIQGEGRFAGFPALFIRLSGCTRKCDFCDTDYHPECEEKTVDEIIGLINTNYNNNIIIVWTGGEPTLYYDEIKKVIDETPFLSHHVESNGDLDVDYNIFDYICISPKDLKTAVKINKRKKFFKKDYDIKIVTDLTLNKQLIPCATMLMPLTTNNKEKNLETKQKVWTFCSDNKINFCLRQHIEVWDIEKRGV